MATRVARACFAGWMIALAAGYYAFPAYGTGLWAALGFSGAVAVIVGVVLNRPARRLPWLLLSAVLVTFTLGDATYNLLPGNPFPSPADGFYLLSYPLLAAALLIFIRFRSGATTGPRCSTRWSPPPRSGCWSGWSGSARSSGTRT